MATAIGVGPISRRRRYMRGSAADGPSDRRGRDDIASHTPRQQRHPSRDAPSGAGANAANRRSNTQSTTKRWRICRRPDAASSAARPATLPSSDASSTTSASSTATSAPSRRSWTLPPVAPFPPLLPRLLPGRSRPYRRLGLRPATPVPAPPRGPGDQDPRARCAPRRRRASIPPPAPAPPSTAGHSAAQPAHATSCGCAPSHDEGHHARARIPRQTTHPRQAIQHPRHLLSTSPRVRQHHLQA